MKQRIIDRIWVAMFSQRWVWYDSKGETPTDEQIGDNLDRMVENVRVVAPRYAEGLYEGRDGAMSESGGILVRQDTETRAAIFMQVGEVDLTTGEYLPSFKEELSDA
jgi:hypothetical protein